MPEQFSKISISPLSVRLPLSAPERNSECELKTQNGDSAYSDFLIHPAALPRLLRVVRLSFLETNKRLHVLGIASFVQSAGINVQQI